MKATWLLAIVVCGSFGCTHNATLSGSCDVSSPAGHTCADYSNLSQDDIAAAKSTCSRAGTWSDSPCDRTNAIGGCQETENGLQTTVWYYPSIGLTADTVEQACQTANGTFVDGGGAAGDGGAPSDLGQACKSGGASCDSYSQCCSGTCANNVCTSCFGLGEACTTTCCVGLTCGPGGTCVKSCRELGSPCQRPDDCCSNVCNNGACGTVSDVCKSVSGNTTLCRQCCEQAFPSGFAQCACQGGICQGDCGTTLCAATPTGPYDSTCETCVYGSCLPFPCASDDVACNDIRGCLDGCGGG